MRSAILNNSLKNHVSKRTETWFLCATQTKYSNRQGGLRGTRG
ncbi:hypothetical protein OSCI_4120027 [Kamptonema sp. PCC 6506]|nr:hypothetical protein OSCI_4120027 [Kamptonema sp. PCC 6506]